jgi:ubiquinone/menaquinone biosynthesis C-methylase UbiE
MCAMIAPPNPEEFFAPRARTYARFIRWLRYESGLRSYLLQSALLKPGLRILDAGCGTGALTRAVHGAMRKKGFQVSALHGFDLTPAMLEILRESLCSENIGGVELAQANVLCLDGLPDGWRNYDLVVSASMLEYVPRDQFVAAITGLRGLLSDRGSLLLFITRDNWLMRPLIGTWWRSNLYAAQQLSEAFKVAGFSDFGFRSFPLRYRYLASWGHIIEGQR